MNDVIMPVYIAIDLSESMGRNLVEADPSKGKRIDAAIKIIPSLINYMMNDATAAESMRVSLLGFNQYVSKLSKFSDLYELEGWWNANKNSIKSKCSGQTYYSVLFDELKKTISNDISKIQKSKDRFFRPIVYFLTDGYPFGDDEDNKHTNYRTLVTSSIEKGRINPNIFCIGIGEADTTELNKYGAGRVKRTRDGYINSEYRTANRDMVFVIKKAEKTGEGLKILNDVIIQGIRNSFNEVYSSADTIIEPDFESLNLNVDILNEVFQIEKLL